MPAPKQIDPTSRRSRLRLYFATNAGHHRAKDVAKALGDKTQYVANECARMARSGDLDRRQTEVEGRAQPITTYGAPTPAQEEQNA